MPHVHSRARGIAVLHGFFNPCWYLIRYRGKEVTIFKLFGELAIKRIHRIRYQVKSHD